MTVCQSLPLNTLGFAFNFAGGCHPVVPTQANLQHSAVPDYKPQPMSPENLAEFLAMMKRQGDSPFGMYSHRASIAGVSSHVIVNGPSVRLSLKMGDRTVNQVQRLYKPGGNGGAYQMNAGQTELWVPLSALEAGAHLQSPDLSNPAVNAFLDQVLRYFSPSKDGRPLTKKEVLTAIQARMGGSMRVDRKTLNQYRVSRENIAMSLELGMRDGRRPVLGISQSHFRPNSPAYAAEDLNGHMLADIQRHFGAVLFGEGQG